MHASGLKSQDWQRLDALLDELLGLDEAGRAARLADIRANEPSLAARLEQLVALADDEQALDHALLGALERLAEDDHVTPRRVGAWRLCARVGYGGMSQVFLAERADGSYRHNVAIKLIWPGLAGSTNLARFQSERQILAGLDDARIARLIDGGITDDGRPWLAMEYVEGLPVDQWCDQQDMSVEDRLRLFNEIAAAVGAAHRRLIIHRDIKPANVLVNADGQVKLLDFGIARLADDEDETTSSPAGERAFTPEFASPEQIKGGAVTTASDVYQLGALLFALLVGEAPRRVDPGKDPDNDGVLAEPPSASQRVRAMPQADGERVARNRQTRHSLLARRLQGDLDAIIARAMAADPEQRYDSANALRDDISRHLQGQPVSARRSTRRYRLGKFVNRNRVGVAASAVILVAVLAGLAGTIHQARIASMEAAKAMEVRDFLVGLFEFSAPDIAQGREITVREMLDRGAERIRGELVGQPEIQADMMATAGDIYRRLGQGETAGEMLGNALEMRLHLHGPDHLAVADVRHYLGQLYADQGHAEQAEAYLVEARDLRRRHLGAGHPAVADTLLALSAVYWRAGRREEAEPVMREVLAIYRQSLPEHDPRIHRALRGLAAMQHNRGELDQAEASYRHIIDTLRYHYGDVHSEIASSLHNLGFIEHARGHHAEAEALLRESLAIKLQIYGEGHPELVTTLAAIGRERERLDDLEGALAMYSEGLEILREHVIADHPRVASALFSIANVLVDLDRPAEAIAYLDESLNIRRAVLGPEHRMTAVTAARLADLLIDAGALDEAAVLVEYHATPATAEIYAETLARIDAVQPGREPLSEPR